MDASKKYFKPPLQVIRLKLTYLERQTQKVQTSLNVLTNWKLHPPILIKRPFEELGTSKRQPVQLIEKPLEFKLKQLPTHLRYAFLGDSSTIPVIILSSLNMEHEENRVLRKHKMAIGWSISDIKGISASICQHKILIKDMYWLFIKHKKHLNPIMKEVVQTEVSYAPDGLGPLQMFKSFHKVPLKFKVRIDDSKSMDKRLKVYMNGGEP